VGMLTAKHFTAEITSGAADISGAAASAAA
jgi:hypothetical protein